MAFGPTSSISGVIRFGPRSDAAEPCARYARDRSSTMGTIRVQVILCTPSEPSRSASAVVTICRHCGDDEWNCFRPQALERVLGAAALELDGGEARR